MTGSQPHILTLGFGVPGGITGTFGYLTTLGYGLLDTGGQPCGSAFFGMSIASKELCQASIRATEERGPSIQSEETWGAC